MERQNDFGQNNLLEYFPNRKGAEAQSFIFSALEVEKFVK